MEISGYGVTLRRLTEDKIETVRNWRNDPKIRNTMFFQEFITPEMQKSWFNTVNNDSNYYFIVEYKGEEIGLINVKDIDKSKGCGESGIFIYEDRYLSTDIAYRAHLVMFDYMFDVIGLSYLYSHIRNDNNKAVRFSLFLGAYKDEQMCNDESQAFVITKENYQSNKNRKRFIEKWNIINIHQL